MWNYLTPLPKGANILAYKIGVVVMRKLAVFVIALASTHLAMAQTPTSRTLVAVGDFPCNSFQRSKDGSWTQVKSITALNVTVTSISYEKGSKEALSLDKRCSHK
jgi:hypothetical protein